ncbi:hypothetical protein ACK3TF_003065 [Chlorella vulgaris]
MSSDIVIYGECLSILASHMWQMAADGKLGDGTLLSIGTAVDYHPAQDDALDTLIRWLYARLKALSEQAHASAKGPGGKTIALCRGGPVTVWAGGGGLCQPPDTRDTRVCGSAAGAHISVIGKLAEAAQAHAIVEDLGGCVLQAGLFDSKGKLLEDWKAKNILMQYNKENMLNPHFVVY